MRRRQKNKPGQLSVPPADGILDPQERQLRYVHLNGQRAENSVNIGGLVRAEFEKRCSDGPAWRRRLVAVIEEHAGQGLLDKIEGMEVRKGVLRLEVAEPAERSALGFQWQQRLLTIMQIHVPSAGISAVRFVMGR